VLAGGDDLSGRQRVERLSSAEQRASVLVGRVVLVSDQSVTEAVGLTRRLGEPVTCQLGQISS
jgi:hypothetical protein